MSINIVPLQQEHVEGAAGMVAAEYEVQRRTVPCLPSRYEDPMEIRPLLAGLLGNHPGVAAISGERLIGFLSGQVLNEFRGKRAVYCPEWAHAAHSKNRRRIYQAMYARLSRQWTGRQCFTHVITTFAHDSNVPDMWFWFGFGLTVVDAMCDLNRPSGDAADIDIVRAGPADAELVTDFWRQLQTYLVQAPVFRYPPGEERCEALGRGVHYPEQPTWLAYHKGKAVAFLGLQPACASAAYIIRDQKTVSVSGAFVKENFRSCGIGTALLHRALVWARSNDHLRCAVDFESQNVSGVRFWMKHFQPICYSLIRQIDERVATRLT